MPLLGLALVIGLSACSVEESPGSWSPPSTPTTDATGQTSDQAAQTSEAPVKDEDLVGTWQLETAYLMQDDSGATSSGSNAPTLTFQEGGTLAVDTGCNTGGGDYQVDGDRVLLSPVATTLRACEGRVGALEAMVVGLLGAEELSFRIEDAMLTLTAEDGTTLAFSKVEEAAGDASPTTEGPTGQPTTDRPTDAAGATRTKHSTATATGKKARGSSSPTATGTATATGKKARGSGSPTGGTATATGPTKNSTKTGPTRTTTAPARTSAVAPTTAP